MRTAFLAYVRVLLGLQGLYLLLWGWVTFVDRGPAYSCSGGPRYSWSRWPG
jgi:hypothetical protein